MIDFEKTLMPWIGKSRKLIDYFFIDPSLQSKLKKANIHPDIYGSDHCPVSIELS